MMALADGRSALLGTPDAAELVREIAGPGWSAQCESSTPHFDEGAVHVLTTATLATLSAATLVPISVARLRPNVLISTDGAGLPEDEWVGHTIQVGEVRLRVVGRTQRCVMVNQAQAGLDGRRDVLKTIGTVNSTYAGVYADVLVPGIVRSGDVAVVTRRE